MTEELLAVEFIPQPALSITSASEEEPAEPKATVRMGLGTAIETADGYILSGYLDSEQKSSYLAVDPKITDANNQIVQTTCPDELTQLAQQEPLLGKANVFALAFKSQSLQFPLTVTWNYYPISYLTPETAPAQTFDAGKTRSPGRYGSPIWQLTLRSRPDTERNHCGTREYLPLHFRWPRQPRGRQR